AVLFPTAGLVLLWLARRFPRRRGWRRAVQWVLIAAFFLGGLRSALWGLGSSVMVANGAPLIVTVVGLLVLWVLRRRGPSVSQKV
ncbi:MAG: hypothetical protein OER90_11660, partial [Gemmatimonadota bacterium]|nr:hypothetical protein [Gemmatimonadota bacterium]